MRLGLPDFYPSTNALPFNRESLESHFQLSTPDQDQHEDGVWLLLQEQSILTTADLKKPELPAGPKPDLPCQQPPLYIGNWQGRPCRMLILKDNNKIPAELSKHSLHAANPQIPISILSLAGVGLMIQHWEDSSRFCGHCGTRLIRLKNEWGKECTACGTHHFPRIHPCVIGLVIKQDEILLVRKPEWVDGRYGLVAGFVDFGESLEEAMVREVLEETDITINNVRYLGSQSWPFPSQLMTGYVADYVSGEIKLQEDELEDGGWYKLDQLPTIPPQRSIARYLIDRAAEFLTK